MPHTSQLMPLNRSHSRNAADLRPLIFTPHFALHAEGSCLVQCGNTHVLCTASVEDKVPPHVKGTGKGWVTAEYGMLPRSTHSRMDREAAKGKQSGRTLEIQRLIGRALRAIVAPEKMGEIQVRLDCDVLQADGGTRTASITGAYVALALACRWAVEKGKMKQFPLNENVAAISCGIINGTPVLDLDYNEDSSAETDANFVMTASGRLIEVQATAEGAPFDKQQLDIMLDLASTGIQHLVSLQNQALGI